MTSPKRFRSRLKDIVSSPLTFYLLNNPSLDTETGPGVFETALAYTSALRMADNAILFKFLVKSVGLKRGVLPSFMAKPWGNVSTTGLILE
jgi:glutamine synthetase